MSALRTRRCSFAVLNTIRVLETVVGPDDARVQRELGPEIQQIRASEKAKASGVPLINANAPEEI
jgi:hypothetical protein